MAATERHREVIVFDELSCHFAFGLTFQNLATRYGDICTGPSGRVGSILVLPAAFVRFPNCGSQNGALRARMKEPHVTSG